MWVDGSSSAFVTRPIAKWAIGCLLVGTLACLASSASAQDDPLGPDPVAADLFRQGRDLIAEGQHAEGCAKLELSMKRFAAPSTLMNIARCREHEGKVATAWALYQRALVLNLETDGEQRRQELDDVALAAITALEARLPKLHVTLATPVNDGGVREGGRPLPLGTAVALDPGEHELVANAPGYDRLVQRVVLREGETTKVVLTLTATPPTPAKPAAGPVQTNIGDDTVKTTTPIWVWAVGGAGLAMAGVAIGFAVDAQLTADALADRCGDDQVCDEDLAFDPAPDNARKNRGFGLGIGFGVGALASLTAATIGLVMSSSSSAVTWLPQALPGGGGLAVQGRF